MRHSRRPALHWAWLLGATLVGCDGPEPPRTGTAQRAVTNLSIPGLVGTSFALSARQDRILSPDGGSWLMWGYAPASGQAQLPGPTLIVDQGATVTVTLQNLLPSGHGQNASILFHGIEGVSASCALAADCVDGPLTKEARPYKTVTYQFTASRPGTFLYSSGSNPDLQIEMGLTGALLVRPTGYDPATPSTWTAYGGADSAYDHEVLFLQTEFDPRIHDLVERSGPAALVGTDYMGDYFANYWMLNGRMAPDTMSDAFVSRLPAQPYNCMPALHPGERLLMRVLGGGRDMHPLHHHGNHARVIARDGWPLRSPGSSTIDLSFEGFTIQTVPGQTTDALFTWTGKDLGWDIYGTVAQNPHSCTPGADGIYDATTKEYCPDHNKALPVNLPDTTAVDIGSMWSGSALLGKSGALPPGTGTLNQTGAFTFMWHSHNEKEITNFNIFPGGMMTMLMVQAPGVPLQ